MIEPNADMPWEIYLDWLEDQGISDLRFIDSSSLSIAGIIDSYLYTWNFSCGMGTPTLNFVGDGNYVGEEVFNFDSGDGIIDDYHGSDGSGFGSLHANPVYNGLRSYAFGSG